jgi:ppGpp synthetase/RelA/SpoT-type nucleotidyltranferase
MSPVENNLRVTQEQNALIEEFLTWYEANRSEYVSIAQESAERLTQALSDAGVPHKIESRAKAIERLIIKVYTRKNERKYDNIDGIIADIVDLAGVRVLVYFPSDKERVEKFIIENFDVHSNPRLLGRDSKEIEGASHQYIPRYPGYCANHYRATLKLEKSQEARPCHHLRVEIQVTTILRHTWAEVGHDWSYKQLVPGGDDEYCSQLLDALSGALEMGEFFMDNMQQRLVTQKELADQPFASQYDLGAWLNKWAGRNGRSEGLIDVQTLWEVLKRFDCHRPTRVQKILDEMDLSPGLARKYEPLPLNIETSIIHSILESDERYNRQREADEANPSKLTKYKLKVVRDCFIWFGRLFRYNHKWFELLSCGNDPEELVEMMAWLFEQSMKEDKTLCPRDERVLEELFDILAGHSRLAVQYVFFLARFRVKAFPVDGYAMRTVIEPLLGLRAHRRLRIY